MSRKLREVALCFFVVVLLVGCVPNVRSGEIVDKYYTPTHLVEKVEYIRQGDKNLPVTKYRLQEAYWTIVMEKYNSETKRDETGKQCVSRSIYNRLKVGDTFDCEYAYCSNKPMVSPISETGAILLNLKENDGIFRPCEAEKLSRLKLLG